MIKTLEDTRTLDENIKDILYDIVISTSDSNNILKKVGTKISTIKFKMDKMNNTEQMYNKKINNMKKMIEGLESEISSKINVIKNLM